MKDSRCLWYFFITIVSIYVRVPLQAETTELVTILHQPMSGDGTEQGYRPTASGSVPVTAPTTTMPGTCVLEPTQLATVRERLQQGGQKRALIVRGGRFGIQGYYRNIFNNIGSGFDGDPNVQHLGTNILNRPYLSDEAAVTNRLQNMGYTVEFMSSNNFNQSAAAGQTFKNNVLQRLRDPQTRMFLFFGHGYPSSIQLIEQGGLENSDPILDSLGANAAPNSPIPQVTLTATEMKNARQAAGRGLDAIILQCCQGAFDVYLNERGISNVTDTWSSSLATDANTPGFFSGWVTFCLYLVPQTDEILNAFFCHVFRSRDLPLGERRASARFFKRTPAGMYRQLARLANQDDVAAFVERGTTLAAMEQDPAVRTHAEPQILALPAIANLVRLVHDLRFAATTFRADVTNFILGHAAYMRANAIALQPGAPPLPPAGANTLTLAQVNEQLLFWSPRILSRAVESTAPGLLMLRRGRSHFVNGDDRNLHVDLNISVQNSTQLQTEFDQWVQQVLVPPVSTGLQTNIPNSVGTQLATRVRGALTSLLTRLPSTLVRMRMEMAVEKVHQPQQNRNVFRPVVFGYNFAAGTVPRGCLDSRESPYEIHASLPAVSLVARRIVLQLFQNELEIAVPNPLTTNTPVGPVTLGPSHLYFYVRMVGVSNVVRISDTSARVVLNWQLRVNWPLIGDRFGNFTTRIDLQLSPRPVPPVENGLTVNVTPTVQLTLGPGLDWIPGAFSTLASQLITDRVRQETQSGINFATWVPQEFANGVVGQVRISRIRVAPQALSVYLDRIQQ